MNQKPKVITLTPVQLIAGVLGFIALAIFAYGIVMPLVVDASAPSDAEMAARWGAQAFLSIDVEEGRDAWNKSVCEYATEESCEVFKDNLGDMIWGGAEKAGTRQSCRVTEAKLNKDLTDRKSALGEIWSLTLDCQNLATKEIETGEIQVSVVPAENGWLFERILFEEEVNNAE